MAVDLNTLLSVFNGSKAIPKNDASYNVIKQLIVSARELTELINSAGSIEALGIGRFLAYGTAAERATFQPTVIAGVLVIYYETDTQLLWVFTETNAWEQTGGGITQLTGDVLAGPGAGSVVSTLSTTGVTAGTYGSSTAIPIVTVDAKGRATTITTATVSTSVGSIGSLLNVTFVSKTTNQSVTSSTTYISDSTLNFAVGATQRWVANWTLFCSGDTAGDLKLAVNVPAGATGFFSAYRLTQTATSPTDSIGTSATTDLTDTGTRIAGMTTSPVMVLVMLNVATVATTGNVTLRWAQNASSGTPTTIYADSYLEAKRYS